jgi:hypothetical protein
MLSIVFYGIVITYKLSDAEYTFFARRKGKEEF